MAYPIYGRRKITTLSGIWDFTFLPGETAPAVRNLPFQPFAFHEPATVPGCFDAGVPYAGKRGIGIYRTFVETETAGMLLLQLPGIFLSAKIFFDGKEVGFYDLPYSGMEFQIQAGFAGRHELILAVDNRADFQNSPLFSNYYDFYPFGGILRPPQICELPETYLDRCRVTTLSLNPPRIRLEIQTGGKQIATFHGTIQIDQEKPFSADLTGTDGHFSMELELPHAKCWSPEDPCLHTLCIDTGKDRLTERFGIRIVRAEKARILVNGKSYPLLGYNRHESHPEFGSAIPPQIMLEDLQILKQMNCNFIRGSHYPQSQEFLDLCDAMGFLVWEEALGWGDGEDHLTDPVFQQKQLEQTERMVKNSMNHPSVILFGFLNENRSDLPCCRELIGKLSARIHELDSTRLVTYATCNRDVDKALEFADVISTNLYPGWYGCSFDDLDPLAKIHPRLDEVQKILLQAENADKPWIISEIGAAALAGCHDRLKGPWSEDFQADYLESVCHYLEMNPRVTGLAIWQFMDCRSYKCSPSLNRARGFNNKGSLDEYRRPKMACERVRNAYQRIQEKRSGQ